MKLRNGFVSNSSSSSFIIGSVGDPLLLKAMEAAGESKNIPIKDVAREMLKSSDRKKYIKWLKKVPENVKFICFNSCNYDTEIMAYENYVTVLTCNNESFDWDTAFDIIETRYNVNRKYIEDTDLWEDLVRGSPYYSTNGEYKFDEFNDDLSIYLTYSLEKIAKEYGPAAYICEKGVMLYENENRICIK